MLTQNLLHSKKIPQYHGRPKLIQIKGKIMANNQGISEELNDALNYGCEMLTIAD